MPKRVYTPTESKIKQHGCDQVGGAYYGATLGTVVSTLSITGSNYTYYSANPLVSTNVNPTNGNQNYSYYLVSTSSYPSSYTATITNQSNEDVLVYALLVGGGGGGGVYKQLGGGGGGSGGLVTGSFTMQAGATYTINLGIGAGGGEFGTNKATSSSISANGTTIVSAGGGQNGFSINDTGDGWYYSNRGGNPGGISYNGSLFTASINSGSYGGGGGGRGGGGNYAASGGGGLCFPNNGTQSQPLTFADGFTSNFLFGGGGGGSSAGKGGGGGGMYGVANTTGYTGGSGSSANEGLGGGGGGGGGGTYLVSLPSFLRDGGIATTSNGGNGGFGGYGGGGGGAGAGNAGGTDGIAGTGGNGVVMIYFPNP